MPSMNILAVASSVSADRGFDTLDAVEYAIDNKFKGFQAYINQQIVNDAKLRVEVSSLCRDKYLRLVAHAPGTLNWDNVSDVSVNSATKHLLALETRVLVVHHFDETVGLKKALECLMYLCDQGITTCLENFFMLGKETSEKCFMDYLFLLTKAKALSIDFVPVLDIPRIYDAKVHLAHLAQKLLEEAFNVFKSIEIPIILHLVDMHSGSQERNSWCPVGQGIIPYVDIFGQMSQRKISIYMVILEFEDKVNPVKSKRFLKEHLLEHVV
jgi:hypothetical protein